MRTPRILNSSFILSRLFAVLLCSFPFSTYAQLCNGSLGDPVVNITFDPGSGSNNYVPTGSYTYTNSTCPDDGYYTITNKTSNCFGNTWFNITSDHTGNGGSFLLVNASLQPGDIFVTTFTNFCPNTTYEFAAWVLNIMNTSPSISPDLTFSVETPTGTVLNSFPTGDIPVTTSPQWKQYGFYFTTPTNNPVIVLRITDHAPGGIGNDFAVDDITFRPCGAKIASSITGLSSDTVNVCEKDNVPHIYNFNAALASGYAVPVFQWQLSKDNGTTWNDIPGATALTYQTSDLQQKGNYQFRLSVADSSVAGVASCKVFSDVLSINVHPKPTVDAGPDMVMLINHPVSLAGNATGEQLSYSWIPDDFMDDPQRLNPEVSPPSDMTYTLDATSVWGCSASDNVSVKVVQGIFVPNAFTPNGDGKNDRWEIPYLDPSFDATVRIFDRWGKKIYEVSSAPVSWDGNYKGEPQPAGVYTYWISVRKYNLNMKGTFSLIR